MAGYYDLKVSCLSTAAYVSAVNGEARGVFVGAPPTDAELIEGAKPYAGKDIVQAMVTDNGDLGDGLCLGFRLASRAGDRYDPTKDALFLIDLDPDHAEMLGRVLLSVVEMRRAHRRHLDAEFEAIRKAAAPRQR